MKDYLKSNKGFTVKELVFTIVAIIIAFIIGFALSYVFTNNSKQYIARIAELENEIQQLENGEYPEDEDDVYVVENEDEKLTSEDILYNCYGDATNVYSNLEYDEPYDEESTDNNSEIEITNYDEVVNEIFTENGKKIFEEENKDFIKDVNGKKYILSETENTGEYLMEVIFENIKEEEDTISATAVRTMTKKRLIDIEDEELENVDTYTLKDEIILKKVNDNWLVDKYTWVVPGL